MEDHFQMFCFDLLPQGQSNLGPCQYDGAKYDSDHQPRETLREFQGQRQMTEAARDVHVDEQNVLEMSKSNTTESDNCQQEYLHNDSWAFPGDSVNPISDNSLLKLDSRIDFKEQDVDANKIEQDQTQQESKHIDLKEMCRELSHSEKEEADVSESTSNNQALQSEALYTPKSSTTNHFLNPSECSSNNHDHNPSEYLAEHQTEDTNEVFIKADSQRLRDKQNDTRGAIKHTLTSTINAQEQSCERTSPTSDPEPAKQKAIDNIQQNVVFQVSRCVYTKSAQNCMPSITNKSAQRLASNTEVSQKLIATNCEKMTKSTEILENEQDNVEEDIEKSIPSLPIDHMCCFCFLKFDCFEKLEIHEKSHADMKPYRCSFCPRLFKSFENRNSHEQACRDNETTIQIKLDQDVQKPKPICQSRRRNRRDGFKNNVYENQTEKSVVQPDKSKPSETNDVVVSNKKIRPKYLVKVQEVKKDILVKRNQIRQVQVIGKQRNTTNRSHQCPMCHLSFVRNGHLKNHLQKVHSVTDGLSCKVCKKFYASKEELEKHEPAHICDICGKICKLAGSMAKHMKRHEKGEIVTKPASEDDKTCKVCGMKFKYSRSARGHEKRHYEPLIHKCMKCPRKFATEEKRANHQSICKSNIQHCKQCNKTFKYNYQLHMHVIEAHSGEYYVCKLCGQKFSNRGAWRTHEKLHTKEKEFKCSICGKEYHFKASLQDHMSLHSDEKPFQCMYCGLNVKTKGALKKHEGLHTGAFVFKCEYCNMTFNSRLKVSTHTQEKHTGREFICEFCGKAFTNSRFLKNHELTHTGEKPFKCPHCNARFRRRHHVTQHIPRHLRNQKKQVKNYYVPMVFQQ